MLAGRMTEPDVFELQAFNDWREARRRGFEVDESKPFRRAGFIGYVVGPSLLFGILTAIMIAGVLSGLAVILTYMMTTAQEHFDQIIFGCSIAFGAAIMAYSAVNLTMDWRELQWHRKTRRYMGEPKREKPIVRYYDQTSSSQLVGSIIDWHPQWKELLARRLYSEDGRWKGDNKAVRDRHFGPSPKHNQPLLYTNTTGMWEEVRHYLVKIGYIDNVNDCNWTNRARADLLERLRII